MRPVFCFTNPEGADAAAEKLAAEKLDARVVPIEQDQHETVYVVEVKDVDMVDGLEMLQTPLQGDDPAYPGIIHCPSCGAVYIEYPARPTYSPSEAAMGAVVNAVAKAMGRTSPSFLCRRCRYDWEAKPKPGTKAEDRSSGTT